MNYALLAYESQDISDCKQWIGVMWASSSQQIFPTDGTQLDSLYVGNSLNGIVTWLFVYLFVCFLSMIIFTATVNQSV